MSKILYSLRAIHRVVDELKPSKICLITSDKLEKSLGWAIKEIGVPKSQIITLPDGEAAKTWVQLEHILKSFNKIGLDRNSLIIALGGGTIGDITGFAASIYLRGIKFIQIPTTLLAQVDSAHGGKTGINFLGYKNQIGSFHLHTAIVIESKFLTSLSREQIIDGLGEIIKAGFIKEPKILSLLQKHTLNTLTNGSDLNKIISLSIDVKNYFTRKDFKDAGSRLILNVGHTFGHAIELKHKISHGRAVLIGMFNELTFTENLGLTKTGTVVSFQNLLHQLKIEINMNMTADLSTMIHDKKVNGSTIDFPVITSIGRSKVIKLPLSKLKNL